MPNDVKAPIAKLGKNSKRLEKALGEGDARAAVQALDALDAAVRELQSGWDECREASRNRIEDWRSSLERPEYAAELERQLRQLGVPLKGEFPEYVFPPFQMEIKPAEGLCVLSMGRWRKKCASLAAGALAKWVAGHHRRMLTRGTNVAQFARELRQAYEAVNRMILQEKEVRWGHPVPLKRLYEILTLRQSARREYPLEFFIHDLGRLRESPASLDGCVYSLGPGREAKDTLILVDAHGREDRFATLSVEREGRP